MQKKNDKLLDKFVKKNYNNELEEVLEKKYFDENTKSILLSIMYKIETAYKDYETVKQNVETKEEFITNIINTIKKDCDDIKIVKLHSKESEMLGNHTFLVEKNKKRIICYPIERKLLYCIAKINKADTIIKEKYYLINETLSELINVGNNISTVEPMRDFNGYSWITISDEIESVFHNLVYQNLRMLVGYKFLNEWIKNKEFIIDYMESFQFKLEELYGEENAEEFVEILKILSVLLAIKFNNKIKDKIKNEYANITSELEKLKDNQKFIEDETKRKRKITEEIKQIDEILNNKEMIQKEYEKRNEFLPLDKKIFSIRILSQIMIKERKERIEEIEKINKILTPQEFVKYKKDLEYKEHYAKYIKIKDINSEIEKYVIKLQKKFLNLYNIKVQKVQTKQEMLKLLYEMRYYNLLPYANNKSINDLEDLKDVLSDAKKDLIKKAEELKVIDKFSKKEEIDYELLKSIFDVRIISLEDLYIKVIKEKDTLYIQLFDENVFEEKTKIENIEGLNKKDLEVKLNKKVKIFH